jgi:hypothetical protein
MKKFFLTAGILMVTVMTATYAQDNMNNTDANDVKSPATNAVNEIQKEGAETNQQAVSIFTRNQFASDFPDATNIRFEKKNEFDEVDYTQKGRKTTAYYDNNSELLGTLRHRSVRDLPADAQTEIVNRYPDYTVVRVVRFNANSDNESYIDNISDLPFYGASSENSSNYFVELKNNDNKAIVLMVGLSGEVSFFTTMK